MKKILTFILAAFFLPLVFVSNAQATFDGCSVTTDVDDPTDPASLSGIFKLILNSPESSCNTEFESPGEADVALDPAYTGFDQYVRFLTSEFFNGSVKKIEITTTIPVNPTDNVLLGNFSLDAMLDETNDMEELTGVGAVSDAFLTSHCTGEDSEGNEVNLCEAGGLLEGEPFEIMNASEGFVFHGYKKEFIYRKFYGIPGLSGWDSTAMAFRGSSGDKGYVLIDIRDLNGPLFDCADGAAPVYLRNIAIVGNSTNNGDFVTAIRNHTGDYSCIRSAGDLHLCDTAGGVSEYHEDVDPNDGTQEWCEDLCQDEDRMNFYADKDGDGFGTDASVVSECESPGEGYVEIGGDCNGFSSAIHPNAIETCGDGIDQDCNGTDTACPIDTEISCTNGIDDDGDGFIDCEDSDCALDISCQDTETDCADGADNDGDGALDCFDSDCSADPNCAALTETQCSDGLDNDGDAYIDCSDTDCSGNLSCLNETECSDDADDDSDGLIDCADADCTSSPSCVETECSDGLDNDSDDSIDCSDSDCAGLCGIDADSDGFTLGGGDCDDGDPSVHPNADLKCEASATATSGIDANCNGIADHEEDACFLVDPDITTSGGGEITGTKAIDCSCNLSAKKVPLTQQMSLVLLFLAPLFVTLRLRQLAKRKIL